MNFCKAPFICFLNYVKYLLAVLFCWGLSLHAAASSNDLQECANGLPNISARFLPECRSFGIFAHLIVWTAKEAGADCWAEVLTTNGSSSSNDLLEVNFGWDPGFRAGLTYGMEHDEWATQLYYTWFTTTGKDSVLSAPGTVHSSFLGNFYVNNEAGLGLSGPSYQAASINWTIHFNMFDWELGRHFWVSESLALRPFLGLKGGWIHQSIRSQWQNPALAGAAFFQVGTENLKNNFWGLGPVAGAHTKWKLYNGQSQFYLVGDFSGAIMWGHWTFADLFENDLPQQVAVHLQNINGGASMIRTFMGFEWITRFNQSQSEFSTKLGYETQFWLDQLQFYSFTGGRLVNELTLQGGTLEFCLDF